MFLTFFGSPRGDLQAHEQAHESPWTMLVPIVLLAVGSVFAGMVWYGPFFGPDAAAWFGSSVFAGPDNHVLHDAHHVPKWVKASPFAAMAVGLALSYLFYIWKPDIPGKLAAAQRPLYLFLLNKWYFDEIYEFILVRPAKWTGRFLWRRGDLGVIDGALHAVAMGAVPFLTRAAGRFQSGYLFHYAFVMVAGAALLVAAIAVLGSGV